MTAVSRIGLAFEPGRPPIGPGGIQRTPLGPCTVRRSAYEVRGSVKQLLLHAGVQCVKHIADRERSVGVGRRHRHSPPAAVNVEPDIEPVFATARRGHEHRRVEVLLLRVKVIDDETASQCVVADRPGLKQGVHGKGAAWTADWR